MQIDENEFFREATLRICGNLEIDKALRNFLLYIRNFVPADFLGFLIYLPREAVLETIAIAHQSGSHTLSIKFPVPPTYQDRVNVDFVEPRITIIDHMRDDLIGAHIVKSLGQSVKSGLTIELVLGGKRMGALGMLCKRQVTYSRRHMHLLKLLNEPLSIALTNSLRYRKVRELKNRLVDDKRYLQNELRQMTPHKIIGADYGLKGVMEAIQMVAPSNSPVLLQGETGVGKEIVAANIHNLSPRRNGPFIKVNCGAISENLIDSELFGHEKGAFTGAIAQKKGRFERASGGTIFLDEIGELPLEAQVRLLRVLQDKEIERVGGERPQKIDSRVIAATHRNLEDMIQNGAFREDLYFRLKVFPIMIPPLRKHRVDIPALVQHFIQQKALDMALPQIPGLAPGALDALRAYDWPGNVRELENAIERALIIGSSRNEKVLSFEELKPPHREKLAPKAPLESNTVRKLDDVAVEHIRSTLYFTKGRIEGPEGAACLLGVNPGTLRQRMRKLGIPFGRKAGATYRLSNT